MLAGPSVATTTRCKGYGISVHSTCLVSMPLQSTFSMRRWRDRDTLTRAYKTGYIYCKRCVGLTCLID